MSSCTSFSTVRSAVVTPGAATTFQLAVAQPPGDDAAWFWSIYCANDCDRAIPAWDVAVAIGHATTSRRPYTIGGGLNGPLPYVEGYVQLDTSYRRPSGVGLRLSAPIAGVTEFQLYGRLDKPFGEGSRFLWNPGIMYHGDASGLTSGHFIGLVQGFGLEKASGSRVFIPSISLVWGRSVRETNSFVLGKSSTVFATIAMSVGSRRVKP